jgi:primosomal protein N' (replication factor Y)
LYKYAGIIVNNNSIQVDKIFTYSIPEKWRDAIKPGYRVKVPFGMGNKKLDGFIIDMYNEFEASSNAKEIAELCEDYPLLRPDDIDLIKYMKEKYLCTYIECIKTLIPSGIMKGMGSKINQVLYSGKLLEGKFLKEPYISIYNIIENNNGKFNNFA